MNNLTKLISGLAEKNKNNSLFEDYNRDQKTIKQADIDELPLSPEKSNWNIVENRDYTGISRMYSFKNLKNMLYFLNEGMKSLYSHRLENLITINSNEIVIVLYTPNINNVTEADKNLSKALDEIYEDIYYIE
jgi:pterin-4a-carbinolamine dehydratase